MGRKRENMHNAIIIVDNALSIAREMTSMTTYHNSSSKIQKAVFFLQWLKTAQKVSFLQTFRAKTRIDYLFHDFFFVMKSETFLVTFKHCDSHQLTG